ncbi:MAG: hypothetical protein IT318_23835 [Anaerolineales bacterium]|nr:hypothetical protein [Anaerolineales bacterium]
MNTSPNALTLHVYAAFSTTSVLDIDHDLDRVEGLTFDTFYPGGLFGSCSFFVRCQPGRMWLFRKGQRLVVRNRGVICWEGEITAIGYGADRRTVTATGYWGALLGVRGLVKAWADTRLTEAVWELRATDSAVDKFTLDRQGRLRFSARDVEIASGDGLTLRYTAPTGQTVKRVTFDYDFSEDAAMSAALVYHFNGVSTYTDLAEAYDGLASAGVNATLNTTHYLYVGFHAGQTDHFQGGDSIFLKFNLGDSVNNNAATLDVEYHDGGGWVNVSSLLDGTASAGAPFAVDGNISFTRPGNLNAAEINGQVKVWFRITTSANLDAVTFNEIYIGQTQSWTGVLYNVGAASAETTLSATGTGSVDDTLAAPSQSVDLIFSATGGVLNPFANGSVYWEITNLVVYTETGTINAQEVVKDWRAAINSLNATEVYIGANTLALVPWLTEEQGGYETAASNLARLAALGDAGGNAQAAYLLDSDFGSGGGNGKPVLALQQQPALTDYEYTVMFDVLTMSGVSLEERPVLNWIIVRYTDAQGRERLVTPDDDSSLTDTASVAAYGRREHVLQARFNAESTAISFGAAFLAEHKDPRLFVSGEIPVTGLITGKFGEMVPVCRVRAGKRIRVTNFLNDVLGVSGAGLTFIISHTRYDAAAQTVYISCGVPDNLAILLARLLRAEQA